MRAAVSGQILERVVDDPGDEGEEAEEDDRLEEDAADDGVVDRARPFVGVGARKT